MFMLQLSGDGSFYESIFKRWNHMESTLSTCCDNLMNQDQKVVDSLKEYIWLFDVTSIYAEVYKSQKGDVAKVFQLLNDVRSDTMDSECRYICYSEQTELWP